MATIQRYGLLSVRNTFVVIVLFAVTFIINPSAPSSTSTGGKPASSGLFLMSMKNIMPTIEKSSDVAVIDKEKCKNCGQCVVVCPFDAIIENRKGFAALVGGKESEDTRLGEIIAEFLSEEEAFQVAEACLKILKEKNLTRS